MASILFLGSQLLVRRRLDAYIASRWKLDHNANADKAERAKKRYELARGRTRARTEAAAHIESLWKSSLPVAQIAFSQPITSTEKEGNRNEENEESFSFDQAAIAVTEGGEVEPETVKDAKCQTIEFDNLFQISRYKAPNKDFFDTDDKVRFYTGLPSMEILMVFFEHISWHVTQQTLSLNWDFKSLLLYLRNFFTVLLTYTCRCRTAKS